MAELKTTGAAPIDLSPKEITELFLQTMEGDLASTGQIRDGLELEKSALSKWQRLTGIDLGLDSSLDPILAGTGCGTQTTSGPCTVSDDTDAIGDD